MISFNLKRFSYLLKSDLELHRSSFSTALLTVTTLLLLWNLLASQNINAVNVWPTAFIWMLYIGGYWLSLSAFRGYHDKHQRLFFLTLPASTFEKFLSKYLLTSIGYVLGWIFYALFYWALGGIEMLFSKPINFLNPFNEIILKTIGTYLIVQPIFLLGSIYFKKHPFLKTVFWFSILAAALGFFAVFTVFVLERQYLNNYMFPLLMYDFFTSPLPTHEPPIFIHTFLFCVMPPFCWILTYFRLKEVEG
jgi:hypothetical protein